MGSGIGRARASGGSPAEERGRRAHARGTRSDATLEPDVVVVVRGRRRHRVHRVKLAHHPCFLLVFFIIFFIVCLTLASPPTPILRSLSTSSPPPGKTNKQQHTNLLGVVAPDSHTAYSNLDVRAFSLGGLSASFCPPLPPSASRDIVRCLPGTGGMAWCCPRRRLSCSHAGASTPPP